MADEDLTDLVKNIDFDTEPGGWDEESDKEFVKELMKARANAKWGGFFSY